MYALRKARARLQANRRPLAPGERDSYFDPRFGADAIKILPGEYLVTDREVMLVTLLGSCVSACIHDPLAGAGGMNHFMLPDCDAGGAASESARYGSYAMEVLINELLKCGARRSRLQAKVFGGGNVIPGLTASNIGARNAQFVLEYLRTEGIALVGQDLLDKHPRRVHYFPRSGRALVKRLPATQQIELRSSERRYLERLQQSPTEGSVELFQDP